MSNELIAEAPEDIAISAPGFTAPPDEAPPAPDVAADNGSVANDPNLGMAPDPAGNVVPVDFSPGEAPAANPLLADLQPDASTGSDTASAAPSVPDPMLDELNRPWEEMSRKHEEELAAYRSEGLRNAANRSLAGRDGAGNQDLDLSFDTDPDKAFARVISHAVVTTMSNGDAVPGGDTGYRLALDRVSSQLFGEPVNGDESAFAVKFKTWSQQRQDRQQLGKTLATQASQAALFAAVDPGKTSPSSWQSFLSQAQKSPGYRPGDDPGLFDSWHAVQAQTLDRYKSVLPAVARVWQAMQQGGAGTASEVGKAFLADLFDPKLNLFDATRAELGKKDAAATALEIYPQLDPKDRSAFMEALGLMARSFPKDQQVTFWNNMNKAGGRAVDDLVRDINSVPRSGDDIIGFGDFGIGTDTTEKLRSQWQEQRKQLLLARNFASDVRQIERQDYDPIKSAWGDGTLPVFSHSADGIDVRNAATGEVIGTAPDAKGALTLAQTHFDAVKEMDANHTAHLFSMLEANQFTTETDGTLHETKTDYSPGEERTTGQEAAGSPVDEQRVREQMQAQEVLGGGTGSMTDLVAGKSTTVFKQRVRSTLNKLFSGASVLDVFHEEAHGFFREALATGRLTKQGAIDAIRALQEPLVGRKTRDGEALHFLPQEGEVSWVQLDEAVAKVMESEMPFRPRRGIATAA